MKLVGCEHRSCPKLPLGELLSFTRLFSTLCTVCLQYCISLPTLPLMPRRISCSPCWTYNISIRLFKVAMILLFKYSKFVWLVAISHTRLQPCLAFSTLVRCLSNWDIAHSKIYCFLNYASKSRSKFVQKRKCEAPSKGQVHIKI